MDMRFEQRLAQEMHPVANPEFNLTLGLAAEVVADRFFRVASAGIQDLNTEQGQTKLQEVLERLASQDMALDMVQGALMNPDFIRYIYNVDLATRQFITTGKPLQRIESFEYRMPPLDAITPHIHSALRFQIGLLLEGQGDRWKEMRKKLEKTQQLKVVVAREEHLPAIERAYNNQLLRIDNIISGNRELFRQEMRGGFILPFDHPHRSEHSDRQELQEVLRHPYRPGKGYDINVLLMEGDEVRGWYEGFTPDPHGMSEDAIHEERTDIEKGNTGKVQYDDLPAYAFLKQHVPTRGKLKMILQDRNNPFAASRVHAIGQTILQRLNPRMTVMDTYWLWRLNLRDPKKLNIILAGNNWSSQKHCTDRHYEDIGKDKSPKGESSTRIVDNRTIIVQPFWTRAMGLAHDVIAACQRIYDQQCRYYGLPNSDADIIEDIHMEVVDRMRK